MSRPANTSPIEFMRDERKDKLVSEMDPTTEPPETNEERLLREHGK